MVAGCLPEAVVKEGRNRVVAVFVMKAARGKGVVRWGGANGREEAQVNK